MRRTEMGNMPEGKRTEWQKVHIAESESSNIYIEVQTPSGREPVGILDSVPFEKVTDTIGIIARQIGKTLETAKPSKASVEIGLEFSIKNNQLVALIARGSGKANLKILLEWENKNVENVSPQK